ncbi:MAG: hypothetical protein ACREP4_01510 [Stenotrophomonas sp.]|uniref:hypothetical protein n=1 Tax=Stenotrophomonas sp. TaxID=69392 RepID=UPI003D6D5FDD
MRLAVMCLWLIASTRVHYQQIHLADAAFELQCCLRPEQDNPALQQWLAMCTRIVVGTDS